MKRKNKEEEQKRERQQHKRALQEAKRRRRGEAPNLERSDPTNNEKQKILIVCEGENTEPLYFEQFKLTTATIKAVGEGYNTTSLVGRAEKLSKEDDYDQVWCVFDKDDFKEFNDAIYMAEGMSFHVGYSNQAFEYWLILHFEDHQGGGMHRDDYCDKLNGYLKEFGVEYDCDSKKITKEIFTILQSKESGKLKQTLAIERAKRILKYHEGTPPAKAESSTTVFELVEELEKYR